MTLDTEDKNYISSMFDQKFDQKFSALTKYFDERFAQSDKRFDEKFERMLKVSDERFEHFFGILREDFNHKLAIQLEITKGKPDRGEVREIVQDEARYIVRDEMSKFASA